MKTITFPCFLTIVATLARTPSSGVVFEPDYAASAYQTASSAPLAMSVEDSIHQTSNRTHGFKVAAQ